MQSLSEKCKQLHTTTAEQPGSIIVEADVATALISRPEESKWKGSTKSLSTDVHFDFKVGLSL